MSATKRARARGQTTTRLRLQREGKGSWRGTLLRPWSCVTSDLVRKGGSFKATTVRKECSVEVEVVLRLRTSRLLEVQTNSPQVPADAFWL